MGFQSCRPQHRICISNIPLACSIRRRSAPLLQHIARWVCTQRLKSIGWPYTASARGRRSFVVPCDVRASGKEDLFFVVALFLCLEWEMVSNRYDRYVFTIRMSSTQSPQKSPNLQGALPASSAASKPVPNSNRTVLREIELTAYPSSTIPS
jgi:hypothetical protein